LNVADPAVSISVASTLFAICQANVFVYRVNAFLVTTRLLSVQSAGQFGFALPKLGAVRLSPGWSVT
jgi:hypothetical protein